jgi:hypothetical protein
VLTPGLNDVFNPFCKNAAQIDGEFEYTACFRVSNNLKFGYFSLKLKYYSVDTFSNTQHHKINKNNPYVS